LYDISPKLWVPGLIVNILSALSMFGLGLPAFIDTPEEATALGASIASILTLVVGYFVKDPARLPASMRAGV